MKTLYKAVQPVILLFFISVSVGFSPAFGQLSNLWSDYLPPCADTSVDNQYTASLHQQYGGVVDLSNPSHHGFTNCFPPPVNPGDSTTHTFGSTATGTVNVIGVTTFTMNAPAQVTVTVHMLSQSGNFRYFSNQMKQLDISGGNLPPGAMIRQSPTKPTWGLTTIENTGGFYTVTSYFDVWTELSMDGGQTWIPCDTSGRMTLSSAPFTSLPENKGDAVLSLSPNPCSSRCDISFSVSNETRANLEVFTASGQLMASLFNNHIQQGVVSHFELDATGFANGLYICKFTSGNKSAYRRLVIIR